MNITIPPLVVTIIIPPLVVTFIIRDVLVNNYTLKIKELRNTLGSINISIDNIEMIQIYLDGFASQFNTIRLAILARENFPSFLDIKSILLAYLG